MQTVRLTVGQAIVRFMAAQDVERDGDRHRFIAGVWGIFGHGNVAGLGQALEEYGERYDMPFYRPQNEQAQVHIAHAFAKYHDRLRAFACTSSVGPGATNMITGAAGATVNRIPVLLFPSDAFANRTPDPVLQQIEHPMERDLSANDAFRSVSRYFDRISRPEQLLGSLPAAFRVLTDPAETGAVTLSLPEDVQAEAYDFPERFFEPRVWHVGRRRPEPGPLADAVRLVSSATAPVIVAGGGVDLLRCDRGARDLRQPVRDPRGRDPGGQGGDPVGPPDERRSDRHQRRPGCEPRRTRRRPRAVRRHPDGRLRDGVEDGVPAPGRRLREHQCRAAGCGQAALRPDRGRRSRGP